MALAFQDGLDGAAELVRVRAGEEADSELRPLREDRAGEGGAQNADRMTAVDHPKRLLPQRRSSRRTSASPIHCVPCTSRNIAITHHTITSVSNR
jgi:hypothetical protein